MYKKVFLNLFYDDKMSYKVKYMLEDIDELEDEREKVEVGKRWEVFQKEFKWKKIKYMRVIKLIQDKRNDIVYFGLDEKQFVELVELMKQIGNLIGYCFLECVKELIKMWKILLE